MAKSALIVAVVLFAIAGPTHGMATASQVTIQLNEVKVATDGFKDWTCADPDNEKECRGISAGAKFTGTCTCHQSATQVEQQAKKRACAEAHGTTVEALEADNSKWANGECQAAVCGNQELGVPAGYTCVDGSSNTVCFRKHEVAQDIHSAMATCWGEGARVCMHADFRKLCGATVDDQKVNPYSHSAYGWYGDHGTAASGNWDDEYGAWNVNSCQDSANEDGSAYHGPEEKPFVCCRGGTGGTTSTLHSALRAMHSASYDVGASVMQGEMNMFRAIDKCKTMNAHVCTHNDMYALATGQDNQNNFFNPWRSETQGADAMLVSGEDGYTWPAIGWYGDHGTTVGGDWNDEYGTWNKDGPGDVWHKHQIHSTPTSNHIQWLNNDGPAEAASQQQLQFRCCGHPRYSNAKCPQGYTLAGDVCFKTNSGGSKIMYGSDGAMADCQNDGAYVCMHTEMQRICSNGMNPYGGTTGWFGDHGTKTSNGNWDDEYGTWDDDGCTENSDGYAASQNDKPQTYACCVNPTPGP